MLVKKANGKWHMCSSDTGLNKAWPKDANPFPSIDWLFDGLYDIKCWVS